LLLRAGYGVLVWGLVPFLVLLLLAGVLAVVIGKAARVTRDDDPKGER
jgi:F0F1-type ATP synthase assembly protein I